MSALYSGLSAIAMNEKDLAEFYYKKTKNLIKESPLKLLLEREIIRKEDKESTQIAVLEKMLIHPETKLLALKNLIDYSIKKDGKAKALQLAKLIPIEKNTPKLWDNLWGIDISEEEDRLALAKEEKSIRWERIENVVLKEFGSFKDLNILEIGAGSGRTAKTVISILGNVKYVIADIPPAINLCINNLKKWSESS